MSEFNNWGDYFWPGQIDECRKNRLAEHDAGKLNRLERRLVSTRAVQLEEREVVVPQTFDLDHLKAVHQHLFQDVYAWAGHLRATELVRPDSHDPNAPGHEFVKPHRIEAGANTLFGAVGDLSDLASQPASAQVTALAQVYAGVNVVHPFFDGNGRANRAFTQDLAHNAGLHIDWAKMVHQNEVMAEAFTVGYQPVADAMRGCIRPLPNAQPRIDQVRKAMTSVLRTVPATTSASPRPPHRGSTPRRPRDDLDR